MKTVFGPLFAAVSWMLVVGGGIGFAQVQAVDAPVAVPVANANPLADLLSMAYLPKDTPAGACVVIAHRDGRPLTADIVPAEALEVIALVGPEGGFTDQELTAAEHAGVIRISLGPHILRVETAAIALAARLVSSPLSTPSVG